MRQPTIVIADDHGSMLDKISVILAGKVEVLARVSNGSAAIEAVKNLRPDILIMDIAMPGVNGIEVAKHLRDCNTTTKIILISADVERGSMEWENLAHAYVLKARMRAELFAAVQEILAGHTYFPCFDES